MGNTRSLLVPAKACGQRLDAFLAQAWPDLTRVRIQKLIRSGDLVLNERPAKPGHALKGGERVSAEIPEPEPTSELSAEEIALDIRYEDSDLLVINKPRGLVVHPAPGWRSGTLVNALLAHCRDLSGIGGQLRPGIVHRLDKDTSGLLMVAKNDFAHQALSVQLQARTAQRRYLALAWGRLERDHWLLEAPIGRHLVDRKRMAVLPEGTAGARPRRDARTEFRTTERFRRFTLVEAKLLTGRTHQIRVHLAYLGYPIVGDLVYGRDRSKGLLAAVEPKLRILIGRLSGQALHAYALRFMHPRTEQEMELLAELPADMAELVGWVRGYDQPTERRQ